MSFEIIKRNYDRGLWTKQMVSKAVEKGVITAKQYKEITGEIYKSKNKGRKYLLVLGMKEKIVEQSVIWLKKTLT